MRTALRTLLATLGLMLALTSFAAAAELVMVDLGTCIYCAKFRREVAPTYSATEAGKVAPLRRVSILKRWPDDLAGILPARATPVFILVENGREIGRFAGYSSPERFWARLDPLLKRLR